MRAIPSPPSLRADVLPAVLPPVLYQAAPTPRRKHAAEQPGQPSPAPIESPLQQPTAPALLAFAPSARMHYKVTAQSRGVASEGDAMLSWWQDGQSYEAQWQVHLSSLPARSQHSHGLITRDGLAPARFSDRFRTEEATHFERDGGKLIFSTNRPQTVLQAGTQDRLSVLWQLAAMFAASPSRFAEGTSLEVQTASTRELQPWAFTVGGAEALVLPGGSVEAVRLVRMPTREYDIKVELWLAPGAAYAPVRLRLTQPNGDWADHQWSSTDR